jgi:hypothetical protein
LGGCSVIAYRDKKLSVSLCVFRAPLQLSSVAQIVRHFADVIAKPVFQYHVVINAADDAGLNAGVAFKNDGSSSGRYLALTIKSVSWRNVAGGI